MRSRDPSLVMNRETWVLTVASPRNSSAAITALDRPTVTSRPARWPESSIGFVEPRAPALRDRPAYPCLGPPRHRRLRPRAAQRILDTAWATHHARCGRRRLSASP